MRDGTVQQVDTPQELYREPRNLFVAAFIGSPSMNLVDATLTDDAVLFAGFRVPLAEGRRPTEVSSDTVILGIRPQDFDDARTADPSLPVIEVEVAVVEELGSATHVLFTIEAPPVDVDSVRAASDDGERAILLATDRRAFFTAEVPEGTVVRPGERIRLAVDPGRFHFFDPETGATLRPGALAATA
jgi:multiple sugar transport system ATP-binding protein